MKILGKLFNLLLLLAVVAVGVLGARYMIQRQQPPLHQQTAMDPRPVEVMTLIRRDYTPTVVAYGDVEPQIVYEGRAEVSGRVSFLHPDLRVGGSIAADTRVIEINPEDYQTSLNQTRADLSASQSQLAQLQQEEENTRNALKLALQNLKTAQQNMANVRRKAAPIEKNTGLIQRNINLAQQNMGITRKNLELAKQDLALTRSDLGPAQSDLTLAKKNLALAQKEMARISELGKRRLIPLTQVDAQEQVVTQQQQAVSQRQLAISQKQQSIAQKQQQILQLEQSLVQQQQSIVQQEQQLTQQDTSVASQDQSVLQQQQQIIQYQQTVTDLQGRLDTYASRRTAAVAQIERSREQVKGQQTTLGRTVVNMPFDARISKVGAEQGEFVSTGSVLFEAINTDGVEVRAEIPLRQLAALLEPLHGQTLNFHAAGNRELLDTLNLTARVRLVGMDQTAVWNAEVVRLAEAVDPVRRTLGVVVAVANPLDDTVMGERLPLLKGMYVQVEIQAPPIPALVVPRHAIHQGQAYVMDADDQLEIRPLTIRLQDSREAVITDGITEGERVVLNDLIPVIPGMPLITLADAQAAASAAAARDQETEAGDGQRDEHQAARAEPVQDQRP